MLRWPYSMGVATGIFLLTCANVVSSGPHPTMINFLSHLNSLSPRHSFSSYIPAIEKEASILLKGLEPKSETLLSQTDQGYVHVLQEGGGLGKEIIFKRKPGDGGKAFVVLTPAQDHLPHREEKRTFVLLRQNPHNPSHYWVMYAYVRDASPQTPGAVQIDGSHKMIEFDTWDHRGRGGNEAEPATLAAMRCRSSPMIPCRIVASVEGGKGFRILNEEEFKAFETEVDEKRTKPADEPDYPEGDSDVVIRISPPRFKAVTKEGYSVAANYDLYSDLDDDTYAAKVFGQSMRVSAVGEDVSSRLTALSKEPLPTIPELGHKKKQEARIQHALDHEEMSNSIPDGTEDMKNVMNMFGSAMEGHTGKKIGYYRRSENVNFGPVEKRSVQKTQDDFLILDLIMGDGGGGDEMMTHSRRKRDLPSEPIPYGKDSGSDLYKRQAAAGAGAGASAGLNVGVNANVDLSGVANGVGALGSGVANGVGALGGGLETVGSGVGDVLSGAQKVVGGALDGVGGLVAGVGEGAYGLLSSGVGVGANIGANMGGMASGAAGSMYNAGAGGVGLGLNAGLGLGGAVQGVGEGAQGLLAGVGSGVSSLGAGIGSGLWGMGSRLGFGGGGKGGLGVGLNVGLGAGGGAGGQAGGGAAGGAGAGAGAGLGVGVNVDASGLLRGAGDVVAGVGGAVENVGQGVQGLLSGVGSGVASLGSGLSAGLSSMGSSVGNAGAGLNVNVGLGVGAGAGAGGGADANGAAGAGAGAGVNAGLSASVGRRKRDLSEEGVKRSPGSGNEFAPAAEGGALDVPKAASGSWDPSQRPPKTGGRKRRSPDYDEPEAEEGGRGGSPFGMQGGGFPPMPGGGGSPFDPAQGMKMMGMFGGGRRRSPDDDDEPAAEEEGGSGGPFGMPGGNGGFPPMPMPGGGGFYPAPGMGMFGGGRRRSPDDEETAEEGGGSPFGMPGGSGGFPMPMSGGGGGSPFDPAQGMKMMGMFGGGRKRRSPDDEEEAATPAPEEEASADEAAGTTAKPGPKKKVGGLLGGLLGRKRRHADNGDDSEETRGKGPSPSDEDSAKDSEAFLDVKRQDAPAEGDPAAEGDASNPLGLLGGLGSGLAGLGKQLAAGNLMGGIGQLVGGDAGAQLLGEVTVGQVGSILGGVGKGAAGGFVSGMTGGAIGGTEDDGSFTYMAKDAAAEGVADGVLGDKDAAGTVIGEKVIGGLGGTLDNVLPITGGAFGRGFGALGKAGDNTGGAMFKAGAGGVARKTLKGAAMGGMDAGMGDMFGRRKRSTEADFLSSSQRFVGFGPCPAPEEETYLKLKAKDVTLAAVYFHLSLLRVQCLPSKMKDLEEVLVKEYLAYSPIDTVFYVPRGLDVLNKAQLTAEETMLLSRSLEMASFSQLVQNQKHGKEYVDLTNIAETNPMTRFALHFLTQAKTLAPRHFVKVTRNMVRTLRAALNQATQDYAKVSYATAGQDDEKAASEKQRIFEQVYNLAGMIHFYVNGLGPINAGGEDVASTFVHFLKQNEQEVYKRALSYCAFDV